MVTLCHLNQKNLNGSNDEYRKTPLLVPRWGSFSNSNSFVSDLLIAGIKTN